MEVVVRMMMDFSTLSKIYTIVHRNALFQAKLSEMMKTSIFNLQLSRLASFVY